MTEPIRGPWHLWTRHGHAHVRSFPANRWQARDDVLRPHNQREVVNTTRTWRLARDEG